jgi:hypothetical protein
MKKFGASLAIMSLRSLAPVADQDALKTMRRGPRPASSGRHR